MDIDQLKSATEDQMELIMTTMMSNMDEFYGGSYAPDAATTTTTTTGLPHHFLDHASSAAASSLINLPSTISFQEPTKPAAARGPGYSAKRHSMAAMREMIFRIAAMQPIHIDPEAVKPPKRRNVRISKDPQSVAARHRRERISERIRILQRLVPGGTKMDTASMLDEAIHYVKFLKSQVHSLERAAATNNNNSNNNNNNDAILSGVTGIGFPVTMSSGSYVPAGKPYAAQNVESYGDS